jgi:hypothetical protein
VQFHLDRADGLDIVLALHAGRMTGTATGENVKAQIDLKRAPGLLPHQQLLAAITAADQQLYDAFTSCDGARHASS